MANKIKLDWVRPQVQGILPVANWGTGSSTQNFVDLTTNQTIAGNKNFASWTLYVDDTNDRVGIWTTTPSWKLSIVNSSAIQWFRIDNSGNAISAAIYNTSVAAESYWLFLQKSWALTSFFDWCIYATISNNTSTNSNTINANNSWTSWTALLASATNWATCIFADQNWEGIALFVDSEAATTNAVVFDLETTTAIAVDFAFDALTTGRWLYTHVNNASFSSTLWLHRVYVVNSSSTWNASVIQNAWTGKWLHIDQDGNGIALHIDTASTVQAPIRVTNLASDPTWTHVVWDMAVVWGKLKICTAAWTPWTWTVVWTQT